ncbi:MAG: hypothetical protein UF228_03315 [Lachnospiraceae bacterium]|nr:hypothetical protein [Lachnospiraceae bacterium]
MRLKYYLRGLGTGILFATIILMISYSYKMSDKQIKEKALKLGMVYPEKTTVTEEIKTTDSESENTTTGEENSQTETTKEETTTSKVEETTTSKVEETTTKEETTKEQTTQESTTKEPQTEETTTKNNADVKTYVLTVTSRTSSKQVAMALESAGIISNYKEFDDYLCDNGYASNIQNGKFTITSDMSYKQIAETITSKPKK